MNHPKSIKEKEKENEKPSRIGKTKCFFVFLSMTSRKSFLGDSSAIVFGFQKKERKQTQKELEKRRKEKNVQTKTKREKPKISKFRENE